MSEVLLCALVGAHFRPPAQLILDACPSGEPFSLQREPDNAYDPCAIRVSITKARVGELFEIPEDYTDTERGEELPEAAADFLHALEGHGLDWESLGDEDGMIQLGFIGSNIPKKKPFDWAATLAPSLAPLLDAGREVASATLGFSPSSMLQVHVVLEEESAPAQA